MTRRVVVASLFLPLTATQQKKSATAETDSHGGGGSSSASALTVSTMATNANITSETLRTATFKSLRMRRLSGSLISSDAEDGTMFVLEQSALGNIGLQNAVESVSIPSSFSSVSPVSPFPNPTPQTHKPNGTINRVWVGALSRDPTDHWSQNAKSAVQTALAARSCVPVFLSEDQLDGHYNHFCKQVLWKPFHYQLPDYPKGQAYEERAWKQYVAVNRLFAETIVRNHEPDDIIWVNDYHLMLVPGMVRQLIPNAAIGFFLHIPFPSSEIFRCLHVRRQLLEGILGADLVGFQTYSFLRHFLMTCTRLLSLDSTPRGIQLENNVVKVGIFPIGINMGALNEKRSHVEVHEMVHNLCEKYAGKKVLIGRDKNDYVKGVRQKMLAFEAFLTQRKEFQSKVVLIQVALSTTEENENESQVTEIVSRINSKFGTIEYVPVVYLQQDISFSHYLALLSMADACLITSLRDGMNLTSHEYVVCQEVKKSPLIISEFAGTYTSLGAALRVNPWDTQEVADAIYEALTMSEEEKRHRWTEMVRYVSTHTAQNFVEKFVGAIPRVHEDLVTSRIPMLDTGNVLNAYRGSKRRIFFLDHDGTIVPNASGYVSNDIVQTSADVVELVRQLSSNPNNFVYLMSGRRKKDLAQFAGIPNVGLCAENGCFLMFANQTKWQTVLSDQDFSWRKQVVDIFEYYTDRTPGSFIQQNDISIIWHFGHADASFGGWQALECQNHIQNALGTTFPITILAKQKKIEIFPRNVNKGRICRRILEFHYQGGRLGKRSSFQHANSVRNSVGKGTVRPMQSSSGQTGEVKPVPSVVAAASVAHKSPNFIASNSFASSSTTETPSTPPTVHTASLVNSSIVFDFILCMGDDRADECMFEYLHQLDSPNAHPPAIPSPAAMSEKGEDMAVSPVSGIFGDDSVFADASSLNAAYAAAPKTDIVTVVVGSKGSSARWHVSSVSDAVDVLGRIVKA
ncbi:hypothetical protein HDU80_000540 [Chytriomyces hyalinus]|nr:hypothetical protein HDU80_000540 [Chytriomyces hyalinus]